MYIIRLYVENLMEFSDEVSDIKSKFKKINFHTSILKKIVKWIYLTHNFFKMRHTRNRLKYWWVLVLYDAEITYEKYSKIPLSPSVWDPPDVSLKESEDEADELDINLAGYQPPYLCGDSNIEI